MKYYSAVKKNDTRDMYESQNNYAKWKNTIKIHIVFIYIKF